MELVQIQPALAGGASVAALLARVESHGTAVAAHAQDRTHNRFFACKDALVATLTRVFEEMQSHPQLISSYLAPFCLLVDHYVPLFMRTCIG